MHMHTHPLAETHTDTETQRQTRTIPSQSPPATSTLPGKDGHLPRHVTARSGAASPFLPFQTPPHPALAAMIVRGRRPRRRAQALRPLALSLWTVAHPAERRREASWRHDCEGQAPVLPGAGAPFPGATIVKSRGFSSPPAPSGAVEDSRRGLNDLTIGVGRGRREGC